MCGVIPPKATNTADTQDLDPWQETLPQEHAWLFLEVFCHEKRLRAEMGTIVLHCGRIRGLLSHFASAKLAEKRVDRVSAFSGLAWKMSYWSISSPFWRLCSPRNWRFTRCWAGNLSAVVLNFSRQDYGSKWSSGEVMRQKWWCYGIPDTISRYHLQERWLVGPSPTECVSESWDPSRVLPYIA